MSNFKIYPKRIAILLSVIIGAYLLISYIDPAIHIEINDEVEQFFDGRATSNKKIAKDQDKIYKEYYSSLSEEEKYEIDNEKPNKFEISNDQYDLYEGPQPSITAEEAGEK